MAKAKQVDDNLRCEILNVIEEIIPQIEERIVKQIKESKDEKKDKPAKHLKYPVM